MAFVKTHQSTIRYEDGHTRLRYQFRINVTSDVLFRAVVPAGFLLDVESAIPVVEKELKASIYIEPKRKNSRAIDHDIFYVESYSLPALETVLDTAVRMHADRQETIQLVIAIEHSNRYEVFQNKSDGRLLPSFVSVELLPENEHRRHPDYLLEWQHRFEKTQSSHTGLVSLGLGAAVYAKSEIKSGDEYEVAYTRVGDLVSPILADKTLRPGHYGMLLNEFGCCPIYNPHNKAKLEIPYTEEAAKFLYEVIMNMARLGMAMKEFLGDRKALDESITKYLQGAPVLGLLEGKKEGDSQP